VYNKGNKLNYLIIYEDGNFAQYDEISDLSFKAVNDKFCNIVKLSDMTYYLDGKWVPLKKNALNLPY